MLKIISYTIVTILLFSFTAGANKSITELGTVEIDDLFYNSKSPTSPTEIAKIKLNQVDKILVENEDLELESLEIADIDLATFGEYEAFLNKYYDSHYLNLNSRFINQKEFIITSFGGVTIPLGQNIRTLYATGSNFGVSIDLPIEFHLKTLLIDVVSEISFTTLSSTLYPNWLVDYRTLNFIGGAKVDFLKYFYSQINIGIIKSSSGYKDINNPEGLCGIAIDPSIPIV